MNEIHIVDTTLRDGQLSLWALGMRTGAMLAIAEQMDQCGFESMEFFGFAGYIKFVREHKENPWDWMGIGAKKFPPRGAALPGGLWWGFRKDPAIGWVSFDGAGVPPRLSVAALVSPGK